MKRFLLTAGKFYYADLGSEGWIGFFDSKEEAEEKVTVEKVHSSEDYARYTINGKTYNWFRILDLEEEQKRLSN